MFNYNRGDYSLTNNFDYQKAGVMQGLGQGIQQGINNYMNIKMSRQKLDQGKKLFDQEIKLNEMKLEQMGLDNSLMKQRKKLFKSIYDYKNSEFDMAEGQIKDQVGAMEGMYGGLALGEIAGNYAVDPTSESGLRQIPRSEKFANYISKMEQGEITPDHVKSLFPIEYQDYAAKQRKMDPEYKLNELRETEKIKSQLANEKALRLAEQNVSLIAGSAKRLSQTYADAIREGGVGGAAAALKSGVALKLGGTGAEKYAATGALPGQKTEIITKMMPLLTQQGDKPGSVRLVSTVFDKLEKTLPDNNTPPKVAKRMMVETLRNMFGFSKAIKEMGITNEMVNNLPQKELKNLGKAVERYSSKIELSEEETLQLQDLLDTALEPIDQLIAERDGEPENINDTRVTDESYSHLWGM
jgi:hypothetical protein